jgi:hypothetical protein
MLSYTDCARLVASARDKQSKPVANNTRVEKRGENAYALRLHATDIATFWEDGRIEVNSGGWRTVTTAQRLGQFVTRHVYSERGTWYVRLEPNPSDPEPLRGERSIPKPFHALNPGDEPVRDDSVPEHLVGKTIYSAPEPTHTLVWRSAGELLPDDVIDEGTPDDKDLIWVTRNIVTVTRYVGKRTWSTPQSSNPHEKIREELCPHCDLFERQHAAWYLAMNGGYGRERGKGYRQMRAMLDRFGTREAWQDAYLDDYRAAREASTAHKAWVERNRTLFEDNMEITAEGYAKRPDLKTERRIAREQKRIDKQRKRIDAFVKRAVDALAEGMPMPSSGDCWGCAFRAEDKSVEPMGVDHLWSHIDEDYFVPSMFANAFIDRGMQPAGAYMLLAMNQDTGQMGGERIDRKEVARVLRRYLYKRLVREHAVR